MDADYVEERTCYFPYVVRSNTHLDRLRVALELIEDPADELGARRLRVPDLACLVDRFAGQAEIGDGSQGQVPSWNMPCRTWIVLSGGTFASLLRRIIFIRETTLRLRFDLVRLSAIIMHSAQPTTAMMPTTSSFASGMSATKRTPARWTVRPDVAPLVLTG